jgi:hypothetical protein
MKVTARVLHLGVPNGNGHLYDEETLCAALRTHAGKPLIGQFGMPSGPAINLDHASHVATNLRVENGYLVADIEPLGTKDGHELRQWLERCPEGRVPFAGIDGISFRTAGAGRTALVDITVVGQPTLVVTFVTDFVLYSINAVTNGA